MEGEIEDDNKHYAAAVCDYKHSERYEDYTDARLALCALQAQAQATLALVDAVRALAKEVRRSRKEMRR